MARAVARPQRIRDPLHNLIEFDAGQFERSMWRVIQTRPFQRLRRIRQLGSRNSSIRVRPIRGSPIASGFFIPRAN